MLHFETERFTLTTKFDMETNVTTTTKPQHDAKLPVSGSLAKQEALKELLDYIDSFHGSGHDYWWINSKIRDKVDWMLERSKANDR